MTKYLNDIEDWSAFSTESGRALFLHVANKMDANYIDHVLCGHSGDHSGVDIFSISELYYNGHRNDFEFSGSKFYIITSRYRKKLSKMYREIYIDTRHFARSLFIYDLIVRSRPTGDYTIHATSNIRLPPDNNSVFNFSAANDGGSIHIKIRRRPGSMLSFAGAIHSGAITEDIKPDLSALWR